MSSAARFDFEAEPPRWAPGTAVHLVAIGGSGMSALARLLIEQGCRVAGSDIADGPVLAQLRALGATTYVGHDPDQVSGAAAVVVSSAIGEDNVELVAARRSGIPVFHRAQALAGVMRSARRRLAIAGANGKTTTTSLATVGLSRAGYAPSFACGATITDLGTSARLAGTEVFVVEADESDGSFLSYRPHVAVVTSVQPDHLDFYGTFAQVEEAYAAFARSIEPGGLLIVCADDEGAAGLGERAAGAGAEVTSYGFADDADLRLHDLRADFAALGMRAMMTWRDELGPELSIRVPGRHNLLNAAAAYAAAVHGCGADPQAVVEGLAGFTGAHRRFELRGTVDGVSVIDDYAHNPAKVAALVHTASELASHRMGRVHVVFQPHLFSRTQHFAREFALALGPADTVTVLDIYGAREAPVDGVDSGLITDPLRDLPGRREVSLGGSFGDVALRLAEQSRPNDLILVVGAGDVTQLAPLVLDSLRQVER